LVVVLVLCTSIPSASAFYGAPLDYLNACEGASSPPSGFADAGLAADCLKAYGVALGKADGTFGENDALRRSQVSSLLVRFLQLAGVPLSASRPFPDVNVATVPDDQVRSEIGLLAGARIIAGFADGNFGPTGSLSVAQAVSMVVRALALIHSIRPELPPFADQGSTSKNYDYAGGNNLLTNTGVDNHASPYDVRPPGVAERGLLAEVLAQGIQELVDAGVTAPVGMGHRDGELGPGVSMQTYELDGPNVVHVVTIDRAQGLEIRSTLATGRLTGRLPTTAIARRWHAVAAVNGDFFEPDGFPAHAFATAGRLLHAPALVEDSNAFSAIDPHQSFFGTPAMAMDVTVRETKTTANVERFNDGQPDTDQLALFTPEGAPRETPLNGGCWAHLVPSTAPDFDATGQTVQPHVVQSVGCASDPPSAATDDVLIAPPGGSQTNFVTALQPGQHVDVRWTLNPQWPGLLDSTGSNTTLIHNGTPSDDVVFGDGPYYESVGPRSAVGRLADGRDVIATVDGRQSGYSVGMTPLAFAEFLVSIGVVEAGGLDGGGSTALVAGGQLVNSPSDPEGERAVGTALVVVPVGTPEPPDTQGVGAAPPTATRRLELDPASLGGWAATLARRGVPLRPELLAAAQAFERGS
jgi:hypothetical protein